MIRFYQLIGLPCTGKSTWIKNTFDPEDILILSTDDMIEHAAMQLGKTYDDIFFRAVRGATLTLNINAERIFEALIDGGNVASLKTLDPMTFRPCDLFQEIMVDLTGLKAIIHDQTNMSIRSRTRVLREVPTTMTKIAVVFGNPSKAINVSEHMERVNKRGAETGKNIPEDVIEGMFMNYEPPTLDDFHYIWNIESDLDK